MERSNLILMKTASTGAKLDASVSGDATGKEALMIAALIVARLFISELSLSLARRYNSSVGERAILQAALTSYQQTRWSNQTYRCSEGRQRQSGGQIQGCSQPEHRAS